MRRFILLALLLMAAVPGAFAGETASVLKVLPHFLDLKGRHTLSPSLYERDAYQARLRKHPEQRGGLRFDVLWREKSRPAGPLKLKIETRSAAVGQEPTNHTFDLALEWKRGSSHWSAVNVTGYEAFGELTAWRATLWDGDQQIAEARSFLW